jgi:hypothetical protein
LAQGELEAAQRDWERIIGDANAAAANVMIAADSQAYAAYSRFMEAQNNFSTASTNLQTAELDFAAAEKRQATALIGAAEDLAVDIGAGNAVTCSANDPVGATGAVYRVDGATNVLRHYPNPDIAASWDPNWASAEPIDCIGFVKGDDMPKNPAAVAAEAFAARVAALGDGNPVRCDTADVGGGPGAVYRTTGTSTLRHYPNPTIATSWDPDWGTTTQGIDCTGFVLGADMDMEPNAAAAAAEAEAAAARAAALGYGNPVTCSANDVGGGAGAVYRTTGTTTLRHYPNPAIADSWDPDWGSTTEAIDCIGFVKGDDMAMEQSAADALAARVAAAGYGKPVRCDTADVGKGAGTAVYRTTGTTTLRHYPNNDIAQSHDWNYASKTTGIDCTGFVLGYDMAMKDTSGAPPGSDPRLKDGINKIGTYEGLNVYEWTWNDIAMTTYGLKGREVGFLTTELDPKYVGKDQYGYEYIKDGTKISEAVKTVRATMK